MIITRRSADIALIDQVWHGRSDAAGSFLSGAAIYCELAISHNRDGSVSVALRGPETEANALEYGGDGEWWGIRFQFGVHVVGHTGQSLINRSVALRVASDQSFILNGVQIPLRGTADAEETVHRMVQAGVLASDSVVAAAWQGGASELSSRSVQRHFRKVTGISHRTARQIARASQASDLLRNGTSILDTVDELGYSDQAHLTRSLRRWTGQTPAQVAHAR